MAVTGYDFAGWANKNDVVCEDGLVIRKNAFAPQDGRKVPLCYMHDHKNIESVIGHAILENRDEGMYAYCFLNGTPKAQHAKEAIRNGDVDSLSVWANNLTNKGKNIVHGVIREVSLCLAGMDPQALIESVVAHGLSIGEDDDEGYIYTGEKIEFIDHAVKEKEKDDAEEHDDVDENGEGAKKMAVRKDDDNNSKSGGKTIGEIFDTLSEEQRTAVAAVIGQAVEDAKKGNSSKADDDDDEDDEEDKVVKHNLFDNETGNPGIEYISHDAFNSVLKDWKRMGSMRDAVAENFGEDAHIQHAIDKTGMDTATGTQTYGFNDVSMLYPDYKSLNNPPEWLSRNMDWVQVLMGAVSHTPFSRIKSVFADITEDEARAKGYIKGKQKKEEVFTTLKRTTDPQTIYKKQKLDKDDIRDITDFDVVAWIKAEMRVMLNEEIARAILIGDGRASDSDDKIQEQHVRPIASDVPLFNIKVPVAVAASDDEAAVAKKEINAAIRGRKNYKGSGNPIFFTTEDVLTEMLLLEDGIGHKLYKSEAEVATAMRVSRIVTCEVLEGAKVTINGSEKELIGVIVNPRDYNVGADKGASPELFDDFDIDYNQYKYLIETRISGALIKPFSAMTLYKENATSGD